MKFSLLYLEWDYVGERICTKRSTNIYWFKADLFATSLDRIKVCPILLYGRLPTAKPAFNGYPVAESFLEVLRQKKRTAILLFAVDPVHLPSLSSTTFAYAVRSIRDCVISSELLVWL